MAKECGKTKTPCFKIVHLYQLVLNTKVLKPDGLVQMYAKFTSAPSPLFCYSTLRIAKDEGNSSLDSSKDSCENLDCRTQQGWLFGPQLTSPLLLASCMLVVYHPFCSQHKALSPTYVFIFSSFLSQPPMVFTDSALQPTAHLVPLSLANLALGEMSQNSFLPINSFQSLLPFEIVSFSKTRFASISHHLCPSPKLKRSCPSFSSLPPAPHYDFMFPDLFPVLSLPTKLVL